jgi:3-oxoacyl-[acyl-carrier-protein] synthase-3
MTGQEASDKDYLPYMEGRQVFKHAVTRMVETGKSLMTQHHISVDDLDLLVPHQANLRINQMVADTLGIPKEKTFNNIHKYGNTTAATIPLCLVDAQDQGLLKPGALVLTLAFGAGFTWGGNLLRW